jgi:hypothetical protein
MTLNIPDELATRLEPLSSRVAQILEMGIREYRAQQTGQPAGLAGLNDLLERLARLPTPEEVLALRPSAGLQERISELLARNEAHALSADEQAEWERYQYVEHLVRLAKAQAYQRLQGRPSP